MQFAGLEPHKDGSAYSFNLLLSSPSDFEGGGTAFELLGWEKPLSVGRGEALLHEGGLMHCGVPVRSGLRYVLVGFLRRNADANAL